MPDSTNFRDEPRNFRHGGFSFQVHDSFRCAATQCGLEICELDAVSGDRFEAPWNFRNASP